MDTDLEFAILRSRSGLHRFVRVPVGAESFQMPNLPYMLKATMDYYTKDIPEGTTFTEFRVIPGAIEYGSYAEKCRVFFEVTV